MTTQSRVMTSLSRVNVCSSAKLHVEVCEAAHVLLLLVLGPALEIVLLTLVLRLLHVGWLYIFDTLHLIMIITYITRVIINNACNNRNNKYRALDTL